MIRVTVEDLETGETETTEVEDNYLLLCAGNKYLSHTQIYPVKGTTILTIKTEQPEVLTVTPKEKPDAAT